MTAQSFRVVPPAEPAAPRRLGEWARSAELLESRCREALTILGALRDSRLLVAPVAVADRERQMTGVALLEMLEVRLLDALSSYSPPTPDELRRTDCV